MLCPLWLSLSSSQLFESPRTRLVRQQKRLRRQQQREEQSAASQSALDAAEEEGDGEGDGEGEKQTSWEDDDYKSLDREMVTIRSISKPGFRKNPLLDFRDDPIGPGTTVPGGRHFKAP